MRPGNGFTTEQSCVVMCEEDDRVSVAASLLADTVLQDGGVAGFYDQVRRKACGEHLVIVVSAFVYIIVKTALGPEPASYSSFTIVI